MNLITRLLNLRGDEDRNGAAVRFAVVGLGNFAQEAILPAFANTKNKADLTALVTGDADKATKLSRKYKTPAHSYDEYDELMRSGNVDAVYIATPNSEHRTFAERAARAGVHVLCEKPLAFSVEDARAIVRTCGRHKVRLMTAYRLHFEEGNLSAIDAVQNGRIGEARLFTSVHTMQVQPDNIRVDVELGGGPLEDIGIYCLNAARALFKAEPEEVTAIAIRGKDSRFKEVPEAVAATLRFPKDRVATFLCGFGETKVSEYRVIGTKGVLKMDPAFTWHGGIEQTITRNDKSKSKMFKHRDQIAAEIIYFADCIRDKKEPEPSGQEGLLDVLIIDALRKSYTSGRTVKLPKKLSLSKKRRPHRGQSIHRSPSKKPTPIKAPSPSRE